jgi:hypothetical protein
MKSEDAGQRLSAISFTVAGRLETQYIDSEPTPHKAIVTVASLWMGGGEAYIELVQIRCVLKRRPVTRLVLDLLSKTKRSLPPGIKA